jgi:hypothetical protein
MKQPRHSPSCFFCPPPFRRNEPSSPDCTVSPSVRAFSATVTKKEEIEVFVDGKSVMIEQGSALIQACEKAGADVSVDIG